MKQLIVFLVLVLSLTSVDALARAPEHLLFGAKEYSRIGANPLYSGGVYAAVKNGETALYKQLVRRSLEGHGIYAVNFDAEFDRVASMPRGQRHSTIVRNGEPFLTINQKGGGFLPDGPYVNRTGRDLIGSLLQLRTREGARYNALLVGACGNVMLLPVPPQRQMVYKPRGGVHIDQLPATLSGQQRRETRVVRHERREYRERSSGVGEFIGGVIVGAVLQKALGKDDCRYEPRHKRPHRRPYVVGERTVCRNGRWYKVIKLSNGRVIHRPLPPPPARRRPHYRR